MDWRAHVHNMGKYLRMNRLVDPSTNTCLICALDHGLTSPHFLDGLFDTRTRVREVVSGGANVLMLSSGIARQAVPEFKPETCLALMLSSASAGHPRGPAVTHIGSVEQALRLGADAVVCYVALCGEDEGSMISTAAAIGEACEKLGMPFIAEAEYPNAYQTLEEGRQAYGADYLLRNARLCVELGADIVKVNWPGDRASFSDIVRAAGVPVVVAGGGLIGEKEFLERMALAVEAGAIGCSVGRNVFQHPNPGAMMQAIRKVMVEKVTPDQAFSQLRSASARRP